VGEGDGKAKREGKVTVTILRGIDREWLHWRRWLSWTTLRSPTPVAPAPGTRPLGLPLRLLGNNSCMFPPRNPAWVSVLAIALKISLGSFTTFGNQ
jgi:hypothetical protein